MLRPTSLARLLPVAFLLLVVLSGCRTYGGYGTTEEIPRQMEQAAQQFADELARAESSVQALSAAVAENSALEPLETRYRDVIAQHEAFLEDHRAVADRFQGSSNYRALNRYYGAIIAEQRLIEKRYEELHLRIQRVVSGQPERTPPLRASNYINTPSYYDRLQNQQALSMQDALRGF